MKFKIYGKDLKKAVDRVGIMVTKKPIVPVCSTVRIEAKGNVITISAATEEQVVELIAVDTSKEIGSDILEEGFCFVNLEKLKKIYNINDDIFVYSDENNLTFRASKKKCSIPIERGIEYDEMLLCSKNINTEVVDVLKMREYEFVSTLTNLKPIASKAEANNHSQVYMAIHLSVSRKRLSAVDGIVCVERKINEELFLVDEGDYHIPQEVATHLNKISNKGDNLVTIKANNKIIEIDGEDYIYKSRLIEELHSSVDKTIDSAIKKDDDVTNGAYSFNIDIAEWIEVTKGYATLNKTLNKKDGHPMMLYLSGEKLKTYIHSEIEMSDCIKVSNIKMASQNNDVMLLCGVNPEYLLKILSLFKCCLANDKVTVNGVLGKQTLSGSYVANHLIKVFNDEYTCALCPIMTPVKYVNQSLKFINEEEEK